MNKKKERQLTAGYYYNDRYGRAVSEEFLAGVCSGVDWSDANPSDENIDKIIELFYDSNYYLRKKMVKENLPFDVKMFKEFQINYIKEHWNDQL